MTIFRKRVYRTVVIVGALAIAYLSTVITLSNVVATRAPGLALKIWPSHSVAHARMADVLIGSNGARPPVGAVRMHAISALRRNPTLASAARDLGLLAVLRRDTAEADVRLGYAEFMSRRDIPTQLWLIERRVAANDIPGALAHYGVALQVAPGTSAQLFPVLASALGQDHLVRPIAELVARGDSWRSQFLYYVNARATDLPNLVALYLYLNRLQAPPERVHISGLIGRLLQSGELDAAGRLYSIVDPAWRRESIDAQLDGGFDRADDMPPLGWAFEPGLAWRNARPGANGDQALYLAISDSGWASTSSGGARRLLLLRPGAYRLTGLFGRDQGAGRGILHIELTCAQGASPVSAIIAAIPERAGRLDGTLRVGDCDQQSLSISVERQGEGAGAAWVDQLRLTAASRGATEIASGRR